MPRNSFLENNIGVVLSTLVAAFVVGTFAMIHNSDKSSKVFETKLTHIASSMNELKANIRSLQDQLRLASRDRWTKNDQREFDTRLDKRVNRIEDRLLKLEIKGKTGN